MAESRHNRGMRILHTMLRVGNFQRSIDFYTQVLGMQLLRTWGTEAYDMGSAYGHIAIGVRDAYAACEKIKASGGNVTREAGPVKGGTTVIAFVTDPDGYKIELIQENSRAHAGTQPDGDAKFDPLRNS